MPKRILQLYKNSFSGLRYDVWLLAFVQLVNRSGTMVVPFMSMYMTQKMGVSITKAGFVMACYGVGSILGSFIGGKLIDRFGFYSIMLYTLFFGGLSYIGISFIENYYAICVGVFFMSLINEAFRPASMTAISAYCKPENLTRSGSLVRLSVNLGWAFGAALGGFLASYNYQLLFWVDGATNILACGLVYYTLPRKEKPKVDPDQTANAGSAISPFKDKFYLLFILMNVCFGICFFQIFVTVPIFMKTELLLNETQIGGVMALNGILIVIFEMITVYSLEQQRKLRLMAIGSIVTGFSFVVFNLLNTDGMSLAVISSVILTAGEILAMPFMLSFMIKRSRPMTIGQYAALYTMSYSVAHIVGSYSGSYVADHFGFGVLWWSIGVLSLIIAVTYYWMFKVEDQYPAERFA